jgi:hypothetical protein
MENETEKQMPVGSDALFACPFCGFEEPAAPRCPNCGACGPDDLSAWGTVGLGDNVPADERAAWNRRASPWCEACKEPDCVVSHDGTCAMIRKYLANAKSPDAGEKGKA